MVVALVEVAEMVSMEAMSGVVVPIAKMSVAVWGMTRSPVSVQPEVLLLPEIAPQTMLPAESVVRAEVPEQDCTVPIASPPVETMRPFKVLVAELVWRIFPPEITSPEAEESPPRVETEIPPANVEEAVEEAFKACNWVRPEI